jgi:hypothetical protein
MGTNCAPSLAYLFIYSYDAELIQGLLKKNDELARSFNNNLRYIGDVVSQNYSRFDDFVYRIYPIVLEIKDTIYIYNIRTLSVNIKFICTSFRNRPVSQRVQMNFIFTDNVRILCLSCNVKKSQKTYQI